MNMKQTLNDVLSSISTLPNQGRIIEQRSKLLADFLAEHGLAEPKSVKHRPLSGCEIEQCFRNVESQVRVSGGQMETGWAFFEEINISIHTIAHAIWITPQNKRLDITPWRYSPGKRTMFLPDERVAVKRGYTVGWSTITSKNPLIQAMALFNRGLDQVFEEFHGAVGTPFFIPERRFTELAARVGLPWQLAQIAVQIRLANNGL